MKPVAATCPACHFSIAAPFFNGGRQPLATLGWPASAEEAQAMARLPLDYVQCVRCTHVWNRSFAYDAIPYQTNPNRMFNRGMVWQGHLEKTRQVLLEHLPPSPTVIDIGCGEGHFVRGLSDALQGEGRFLGFDPNATQESGRGVEFHPRLFGPLEDMAQFQPDLLIMRHVLEHLTDHAAFVETLAWGAAQLQKPVYFFAEMPCIDRVFSTNRLVDFFYEHTSQFTSKSFKHLMQRGGEIIHLAHGYDSEVIYALVRLSAPAEFQTVFNQASSFAKQADLSRATIRAQLKEFSEAGKSMAIWGGTGKAAAFMHFFELATNSGALVVDSDPDKVGTYVPGTGLRIEFRDILKNRPVDVIVIPTQWRARDILAEMQREGISAETVLIEHGGKLIDFHRDAHPY